MNTRTCISRNHWELLCKSTYRRVLLFPLRISFRLPQLSRSRFEGDPLDSSRNVPRPDPSLSPRPRAYTRARARARMMLLYTAGEQENSGLLRSRYEIIPGGLASRKFITINRTRSDEHLAPQPAPGVLRARNSALRILQGRGFLRRAFTKTASSHTDEKDDGIISFCARVRTRDERLVMTELSSDSYSGITQPTRRATLLK